MKTEPTLIIQGVKALLLLVASFGFAINDQQHAAILGFATVVVTLIFAWINREAVYSPATHEEEVDDAGIYGFYRGVGEAGREPDDSLGESDEVIRDYLEGVRPNSPLDTTGGKL